MENIVYLITGASGGIGSAIAKKISNSIEKGIIILHYNSNKKSVLDLKKKLETKNVKIDIVKANLEKKEDCELLCKQILKKYKKVDFLINNAGYVEDKELKDRTIEDFQKTININLVANFYLSKTFGSIMYEQKFGKILNISSTSGLILHSGSMNPTSIDYDCSKAGINALTKNFAISFAPYVNVNAIAPGWVDTPLNFTIPDYVRKNENEKILKQRWAEPEEIAELAWFLIGKNSDFINGSIYEIDGGRK